MADYKNNLNNYNYIESQRNNYNDLTEYANPIFELANILFSKSIKEMETNKCGILLDSSMKTHDICSMLIELVIYGLNILSYENADIFELLDIDDNMIRLLNVYLHNIGFKMKISLTDINYLTFEDYYCMLKKNDIHENKENVLNNYKFIYNSDFIHTNKLNLDMYKIIFEANNKNIFVISFDCLLQ